MKKPLFIKKFLIVFILLAGILFGNVAFAVQPQVVLFCSSWNMKCRDARNVCLSIAQEEKIKFTELDVDQSSTPQKAMDLGISLPPSIPYVYYIPDNKGNKAGGKSYKGESLSEFKDKLIQCHK